MKRRASAKKNGNPSEKEKEGERRKDSQPSGFRRKKK